jgi:GWxTD domain-containing protein
LLAGLVLPGLAIGQDPTTWTEPSNAPSPATDDTGLRAMMSPCSGPAASEDRKRREEDATEDLPERARFWLTEDVVYIISPEERCVFLLLTNDGERDQFIEQFWNRRNPDPQSPENGFKQEHYRRIVFANEHFGKDIPGWKTDRGHVYVMFGPPDSIELHRAGEKIGRLPEEGAETYQFTWQAWHYRYLEGIGENVDIEFVDPSDNRDVHLSMSDTEYAALIGAVSQDPAGVFHTGGRVGVLQFNAYLAAPFAVSNVNFKDLEAMVSTKIIRDQIYFNHTIEFARATNATTFTRILLEIPSDENDSTGNTSKPPISFEVFGRISEPSGRVAETFERSVSSCNPREPNPPDPVCQVNIPLQPGSYELSVAVKNVTSQKASVIHATLDVPTYNELDSAELPPNQRDQRLPNRSDSWSLWPSLKMKSD